MRTRFLKGVVLVAIVSAATVVSTGALAGTGIGGVFNLGTTNTTNASTVLQGSTTGQQLRVVNNATTGTGVTGIGIHTAANEPPLAVDSTARVNNLNADLLDGQTSASFVAGGGRIVSARVAQAIPSANAVVLSVPSFGTLEASCQSTGFGVLWRNRTSPSTPLDVWLLEQGGITRFTTQATANTATNFASDVKGDEMFTEEVGRPGHTATITIAAHWSPSGCIFANQAIVQ
jgi:hypothetical protein